MAETEDREALRERMAKVFVDRLMAGRGLAGSRQDWGDFADAQGRTSKWGRFDPLARQRFFAGFELTPEEQGKLARHFWLARKVVDRRSRDMTRAWGKVEIRGPDGPMLTRGVTQALETLDVRGKFRRMIKRELIYGDGMIALGIQEQGEVQITLPLTPSKITGIEYLKVFGKAQVEVSSVELDESPASPQFGEIKTYALKPLIPGQPLRQVDASRVLHYQTRPEDNSVWGISLFEDLYPIFQAIANTDWAVKEVLFQMVYKVFKSEALFERLMEAEERGDLTAVTNLLSVLDTEISVLSTQVLGKDDSLTTLSMTQGAANVKPFFEWNQDMVAGATDMPKSLIFGDAAGALAASAQDTVRWHEIIKGMQENDLREPLHRLIRLLIWAQGQDPAKLDWSWEWTPLDQPSKLQDAEEEQRKANAQAQLMTGLANAVTSGLLALPEARRILTEQTGFTLDEALPGALLMSLSEGGQDGV